MSECCNVTVSQCHSIAVSQCRSAVEFEPAKTPMPEEFFNAQAGAIVAGESIETAYWKGWDDPGAAPEAEWTADTLGTPPAAGGFTPSGNTRPSATPGYVLSKT